MASEFRPFRLQVDSSGRSRSIITLEAAGALFRRGALTSDSEITYADPAGETLTAKAGDVPFLAHFFKTDEPGPEPSNDEISGDSGDIDEADSARLPGKADDADGDALVIEIPPAPATPEKAEPAASDDAAEDQSEDSSGAKVTASHTLRSRTEVEPEVTANSVEPKDDNLGRNLGCILAALLILFAIWRCTSDNSSEPATVEETPAVETTPDDYALPEIVPEESPTPEPTPAATTAPQQRNNPFPAGPGPSFECNPQRVTRDRDWAAFTICSNQSLWSLEREMADAYAEAIRFSQDVAELRASQNNWLQIRSNCRFQTRPVNCLSDQLVSQTATLRSITAKALEPPPTPAPVEYEPTGPVPRGSVGDWIRQSDYPSRSLSREEQGVVSVRLTIDTLGRVSQCIVIESSGFERLDEATCRALRRRARYEPAHDRFGNPTVGQTTHQVGWQIGR